MLVKNFKQDCAQYDNFEIWDVENMKAFFHGNQVLAEIFKNNYKMEVAEFDERRSEISQTDMEVMENLLEQIGDKHFFIFTYHSNNHSELAQMQKQNTMSFGVDIELIEEDHVYILTMDKKPGTDNLLN